MRVLITGVSGFAGSHLAEHCLEQGDEVWGTCHAGAKIANVASILDRLTIRVGDISDGGFLRGVLSEARFGALFHLAALTFVPEVEQAPRRAYEVNMMGGFQLLQAALEVQPQVRVILVSSAEVYGRVPPEGLPVKESQPFAPVNALAAAKAALEMAAHPFVHTHGLHVVVARPFNHTGPRQRPEFVCSSLALQVARFEARQETTIRVGDVSSKRDFSDVRDVVRAYRLLALHGQKGEAYNLASGQSVSIQRVLELLTQMTRVKAGILVETERVRPGEVSDAYGSYEKINRCAGWRPQIPLEKTLRDLLNWHRDQLLRREG